ncbi:MAG: zinc ribbon domain-containing protein [Caldilineae bacterium]|nr:MAG: zinc ribbon domain-containing protein [Caldilineae bacterium]
MTTCSRCGHENKPDVAVCERCGTVLTEEALPPPRLLAQIQGLIPPEPAILPGRLRGGSPHPLEVLATLQPDTIPAAAPLPPKEETVAGEESAGSITPTRTSQASALLVSVGAILILSAVLGRLLPPLSQQGIPRRPAVDAAYRLIDTLPQGAAVLIAWDYEPTTQGEMQLLAQPILQHLRLKQARLAHVSLRPTGPAVAASAGTMAAALDISALAQPPAVQLGFVPGDAAAVRALALSPAQTTTLDPQSVRTLGLEEEDSLQPFALLIQFSAETAATQEWVEQVASRQTTPFIVAASGAVAPVLRPYEQTGQIDALLSSYADALAYEERLGRPGPASRQENAQSMVHLFFILIVLIALFRSLLVPDA